MARINTRASSAAKPEDENVRQLDQARNQNDLKLKSKFERIFRKYGHNFEGVGDEIDIHSGEIVVDNGHLQNMRDEADPGRSASSRFVRTFQEKLEHEDEGEEDESGSGEEEDESEGSSGSDDGDINGDDNESNDSQSVIEPFRALTRPPPRLAQLLVGGSKSVDENDDQTSQDQDPSLDDDDESGTSTPVGLLGQIPALQESMSALTGRSRRSAMDEDTIKVLGTTIANQLAQLMAGPSKPSKKRKRPSQPKSRTIDPVWDYPDINPHNTRHKRKRSSHAVIPPPISSPPAASPGQRSLWAPEGVRQSKRFKESATPSLRRLRSSIIPSSAVKGSDLTRCMNCSLTNSTEWQAGPDGEDLCASCGKYYEHHGRMKPFDSPTPSVEERDSSDEPVPEMSIGQPLMTQALVSDTHSIVEEHSTTDEDSMIEEHFTTNEQAMMQEPSWKVKHSTMEPHTRPEIPRPNQYPSMTSLAENAPPETTQARPALHHVSPTPSEQGVSTYSTEVRPDLDDSPDGFFITEMETPETYPANTSRQMMSVAPKNSYSVEEDALIIKLKEQYGLPWHVIVLQLPQRTLFSVQNRYTRALHNADGPGRDLYNTQRQEQEVTDAALSQLLPPGEEGLWTQEQDELLLELREAKELEWVEIARILSGHSAQAAQTQYEKLVEDAKQKQEEKALNAPKAWSADEDAHIVRLKEIEGLAWHHVAAKMGNRSMQSIQKRYSRRLAPEKRIRALGDVTMGTMEELILEADPELAVKIAPGWKKEPPFALAEDDLIRRLVTEAGIPQWAEVAANLPGRSVRSVYMRYMTIIEDEEKDAPPEAPQSEPSQPEVAAPTIIAKDYNWKAYTPRQVSITRRTDAPPHSSDHEGIFSALRGTPPAGAERSAPASPIEFSESEDNIIMQLKASHNASWEEISLRLPGRSVGAIAQRFSELLHAMSMVRKSSGSAPTAQIPSSSRDVVPHAASTNTKSISRRYTAKEDELIARCRAENLSWEKMAPYFNNRTPSSLSERWHCKLRPQPRKSLPAPTNAQSGLLRTALDNSRRRSDAHPASISSLFQSRSSIGEGNAEDPITFEDDVEMAAASEQLFEEFRSSVVQKPASVSQIDPQLLEMDRVASDKSKFERLMLAAHRFAAEQSNPRIVQQISQVYHSNAGDARLHQLLELTNHDGSHTSSELECAFEAFDNAHGRAAGVERGIATSTPTVSQTTSTSVRDKGKSRASEPKANMRSLPAPNPAQLSRTRFVPAKRQSHAPEVRGSPQTVACSSKVSREPNESSAQHVQGYVQTPAAPKTRHPTVSPPHAASNEINSKPVATSLPAGKATVTVTKQVPAKPVPQDNVVTNPTSINPRQHRNTSIPEQSLSNPPRPSHSYADLIRSALDATRLKAMEHKAICTWVERSFEYYQTASPTWKSNILKELHRNGDFEQCGNGPARLWRVVSAAEREIPQPTHAGSDVVRLGGAVPNPRRIQADPDDDYTVPGTDQEAYEDADDDEEDSITVKPPPKKRSRPRGKRTTDSKDDVDEYTPAKGRLQIPAVQRIPTRSRLRSVTKPVEARNASSRTRAPDVALTLEIADSDGGDDVSSSPVQKSSQQTVSSGKKVRFVEAVEVKGPARTSAADVTPFPKKSAHATVGSDTREPEGSSSSPSKVAIGSSASTSNRSVEEIVPSSSQVFMKPSTSSNKSSQPKASSAPVPVSTPFPRSKGRLSQLRRESTSAVVAAPETPKTNWPRRHSTPTAIFSHRSSPALGRDVMHDRFGFGRKRVVETPVRELMKRKDVEEDELA